MEGVVLSRVSEGELSELRRFCNENWGSVHPLINDEGFFDYYYRDGGKINFASARDENKELLAVCGFIKASESERPDVWISFLLAKKGAPPTMSMRLIEYIRALTRCRTIACNNIRKKTAPIYKFMGYAAGDATQYVRLNSSRKDYTICNITQRNILLVKKSGAKWAESGQDELRAFPFERYRDNKPFKDERYFRHRFFENPYLNYRVFRLELGEKEALLALRVIECGDERAIRIVDFFGDISLLCEIGEPIENLLKESGAQFADFYAFGVSDETMRQAGFLPRGENIVPPYLEPLDMKNVDFTVFTSDADGYVMFKADGDQDRANI